MKRTKLYLLAALVAMAPLPQAAFAEEHITHHVFHGRDVRHFVGRDLEIWRAGHWVHEWHNGRFGWWWFAGGIWYFYPAPIYPYPTMVSDVTFVEPEIAPPPAAPGAAPAAPTYYYCDNPPGYYPYVANCSVPFRPVAPPAPPPGSAPPASGYAPPPNAIPAPAPH